MRGLSRGYGLCHALVHERGWVDCRLIVGELWSIGVLLGVRVRYGLVKSRSHCNMVGQVSGQLSVEIGGPGLKVSGESPILHWQVVVFFFVHLFVDDILLSHAERPTSTSLVNLGGSTGRLDSGLKTSVTSSRRGNISTGNDQRCSIFQGL